MPNFRIIMDAMRSPWSRWESSKCSRRTWRCCAMVGANCVGSASGLVISSRACWKSHGLPIQPRATETMSTPVCWIMRKMSWASQMSPDPPMVKLGVWPYWSTKSLRKDQRDGPIYFWVTLRPWTTAPAKPWSMTAWKI